MRKTKIILSSIISGITGLLGIIGLSGFCCTLTGAIILSFLGLASISSFLVYNNKWLILTSIIFGVLAIVSYHNYKYNDSCPNKNNIK